jgi:hypothetical protein
MAWSARWRGAHDGADRPGERFEIAIHRVVVGGVAALALAPVTPLCAA